MSESQSHGHALIASRTNLSEHGMITAGAHTGSHLQLILRKIRLDLVVRVAGAEHDDAFTSL